MRFQTGLCLLAGSVAFAAPVKRAENGNILEDTGALLVDTVGLVAEVPKAVFSGASDAFGGLASIIPRDENGNIFEDTGNLLVDTVGLVVEVPKAVFSGASDLFGGISDAIPGTSK
jgi:hypothetical protein